MSSIVQSADPIVFFNIKTATMATTDIQKFDVRQKNVFFSKLEREA